MLTNRRGWYKDGSQAEELIPNVNYTGFQYYNGFHNWLYDVITMARDGSDIRVLATVNSGDRYRPGPPSPGNVFAPNPPPPPSEPPDISICASEQVVPPEYGPQVVKDCTVLLTIRAQLGADPPLNWGKDNQIQDWEGIILEKLDGEYRVTSLWLQGILAGSIPPEIGQLTGLQQLNLIGQGRPGQDALVGPIPPELGNLTHLKSLWMSRNYISGQIPEQVNQLPNLVELDVWFTFVSGCVSEKLGEAILNTNQTRYNAPPPQTVSQAVDSLGLSICTPTEEQTP